MNSMRNICSDSRRKTLLGIYNHHHLTLQVFVSYKISHIYTRKHIARTHELFWHLVVCKLHLKIVFPEITAANVWKCNETLQYVLHVNLCSIFVMYLYNSHGYNCSFQKIAHLSKAEELEDVVINFVADFPKEPILHNSNEVFIVRK